MEQAEFVLGAVAVQNVKTWDCKMSVLTGFEAFKLVGKGTPVRQFECLKHKGV
jgi:hypothetical protein